jgi:capsular exopolysaccharide synthesis family protein
VLNDLWVLVQTRLKESQLTGAVGDPTIRLVDAATPSSRPVRPSLLVNLALSAVLGCLVGLAALLAREYSDRSVRSRADALSAAGLPVLGAIPRVSQGALAALPWRRGRALNGVRIRETGEERALAHKRNPRARSIVSMLVTHPGTSAAYVESFNQLFANLALVYWQRPLKVIVFTSPLPGEGKTLSAINFALTGAARGLRVLIVDADLRCGVVNTVLACGRAPGFAELLAGTSEAGDVLRQVHIGDQASLYVVPSGALPKVPGRVLTVERVHAVIAKLSPMFDFVVVDTPPVNLLADAALLGSAADAVMMVIRAGHTKADDLRYAMEQLEATKAPVIGTLLNDIDLRRNSGDDGAYRYLAQAERYRVSAD